MKLAAVILNWNAADDTIRCVSELTSWKQLKPDIFVVDNASDDNSVGLIGSECPGVYLICNQENLGFTGGTNKGIAKALTTGNLPILLLNNDASIDEAEAVRLLQSLEENKEVGIIGPLLFDTEQVDRLISAGGKSPIKHHHTRILKITPGEAIRSVENVSGTAVIIRPEVFSAIGYLDEDYFFSTELADFCMRAQQYGYRSAIDTRAKAYHAVSRSSGLRDTLYVYYIIRNRFIFIRNSFHKFKLRFFVFWALYSLALSLKLRLGGQRATAHAVYMGLMDGLQGRFGGQNERVMSACSKFANLVKLPQ